MARKIKRRAVKLICKTPSKTIQSESGKADINRIVQRGIAPPDPSTMQYGDFTNGDDFQAVQDRIVTVKRTFDRLSAEDRYFFQNDPKNMLDFMQDPDPEKQAMCVDMGLKAPPPSQEPSTQQSAPSSQEEPPSKKPSQEEKPKPSLQNGDTGTPSP